LTQVGLPQLVEYLDDIEPWAHILSLGEQQRIAIARILLQQPILVFMDEATSALDEASETMLYQLIFAQLPKAAIVSVGHRTSLVPLHTRFLTLTDGRLTENH
nr:ATP-binding cassette domain-containing protein [Halothiobacillus sp.]